jgi:hypothetical protein
MDELSRYGRTQRGLEWAGICIFILLVSLQVKSVFENPVHIALACSIAAWVVADLLSGVAHWAFDSFGSVRTPIFGPAFIRPFREHHVDPAAMTKHDFVETNGASCLACVPLLGLAVYAAPGGQAFLVFLCLGILVTNQCHKWAHMARPPAAVALLQELRLVLRPEVHRLHHRPPYASYYCTASGWLNPLLNALLRR